MSEQNIYSALRSGGLSHAGACAMMGNMYCESALISNNVEDRCTLGDFDYTYAVDVGTISRYQFKTDAFGYGLCQWTYPSRKEGLYNYARELGVSIGDEIMQCAYCLMELERDYPKLLQFLRTTDDLAKATEDICSEFERPAVNNFADRINMAKKFYNQFSDETLEPETVPPVQAKIEETCTVTVRVLKQGDLGRDVFMLQCGLDDMMFSCGIPDGDFGNDTRKAVCDLQRANGLLETGRADESVWSLLLRKR